MNKIYERLKSILLIAPEAQTAAGETTSSYIDCSTYGELFANVSIGALAAEKKVTVKIYSADDTSGTNAAEAGSAVYTAPTGGATSATVLCSAMIIPSRKRYYAVKVSNDAAAAVPICATALATLTYNPDSATPNIII